MITDALLIWIMNRLNAPWWILVIVWSKLWFDVVRLLLWSTCESLDDGEV